MEPGLRKLAQMRLISGGGSPASKFQRCYGISSVFVLFSAHGPPVSPPAPQFPTCAKHDSEAIVPGTRKKIAARRELGGISYKVGYERRSHGPIGGVADTLDEAKGVPGGAGGGRARSAFSKKRTRNARAESVC